MRLSKCFTREIVLVTLLLAVVSLTAWGQVHGSKRKPKASKKAQPEPSLTELVPDAPPPPPTPEQMPARPPSVTYQNGLLSIVAPNSTLSDILQAVKSKTGAAIDIPPGATERVVSQFGPGPARDVIAALLNGSHFNYVMIGSDKSPDSVAQVILTPRTSGADTGPMNPGQSIPSGQPAYSGQIMQPQPFPQPGGPNSVQVGPQVPQPDPSADAEEDDAAQQQQDDMSPDPGAPEQANQDGQENGPQVKTPEQLLQELQQQQQMQQQQQQQGQQPVPPAPTPAPPQ